MRNKKLDQNKLGIIVNSLLLSASFLIFQLFDNLIRLCMERPEKPFNFDIFVFSAFYLVHFWIVSVYITHSSFMRKYINRDIIGNPYLETGKLDESAQSKN
ncbi:unnamed protein product [Caenorhabditis brenneri]